MDKYGNFKVLSIKENDSGGTIITIEVPKEDKAYWIQDSIIEKGEDNE